MTERQKLKIIAVLPALVLAALLAGCGRTGAAEAGSEAPAREVAVLTVETPVPEEPPAELRLAPMAGHPALLTCLGGRGEFRPERGATRLELFTALGGMLRDLPQETAGFTDLRPGSAGCEAAAGLTAAGILPSEDGAVRPGDAVTRGELGHILRRLGLSLSGAAGERAAALSAEVLAGAAAPEGGAADPEEAVTRAELAMVLVRLVGREPDGVRLFLAERLPPDVALDDYAWAYIADAVTAGTVPAPEPGVHRAYGWLYAVWEDGTLIRDMDWGVWTFGPDGRYTTGSEALDGYLENALAESGADGLTGRDALEAAYLYIKYHGEYIVRPEDEDVLEPGVMGWEYERAERFFRYGGGTCYGYAAAFGLMARALGETAYIVSAEVNQFHGAHAFVVIPEDGIDWVYDVELEDTRPERHEDLDLFRIEPLGYYNYWYYTDWA